jgi:membrane glycosyltransferase
MLFLTITGALLSALLGAIILATGTTERPTRIADLRPLRSSAIFLIVFAFHPEVALVFADLLSDFTFLVNTNTAADSCGVECMSIYDVYVLNEPKRPDQDLIVYEQADEVDQPGR